MGNFMLCSGLALISFQFLLTEKGRLSTYEENKYNFLVSICAPRFEIGDLRSAFVPHTAISD